MIKFVCASGCIHYARRNIVFNIISVLYIIVIYQCVRMNICFNIINLCIIVILLVIISVYQSIGMISWLMSDCLLALGVICEAGCVVECGFRVTLWLQY